MRTVSRKGIVSTAALFAVCGAASGGPTGPGAPGDTRQGPASDGFKFLGSAGQVIDGGFSDDFEAYAAGGGMAGQGGWELWYSGGGDVRIVDNPTNSGRRAARAIGGTDIANRQQITSGVWEFTIQTYVPSTITAGLGAGIIMLNQYGDPNIDNWSMQLMLNENFFSNSQPLPFMIESQWDGAVLPLVLDEWVEVRALIDLDNDTWDSWYNGEVLAEDLIWTSNGFSSGPGITEIAVFNLWSSGTDEIYFDDVVLQEAGGCICDTFDTSTGVGVCDIFDFLGFQDAFVGGDPAACGLDGDPACTVFDFLEFQDLFVAGCP
jgi:hypothetical protein